MALRPQRARVHSWKPQRAAALQSCANWPKRFVQRRRGREVDFQRHGHAASSIVERGEELVPLPLAIIREIMAGFSRAVRDRVRVEPDRRKAIAAAIEAADPGDVVLIAGKGHEDYQVLGTRRVHFDDVETAQGLLRRRSF